MDASVTSKAVMFIVVALLLSGMGGCVFDDDEQETPDRGTYALVFSDSTMSTCPGGGDVIICAMTPAADFTGSVKLSVRSDDGINAALNRRSLTTGEAVTEVIIKPDSTLMPGTYNVTFIHRHGSATDTLAVPVVLSDIVKPFMNDQYVVANKKLDSFLEWIQTDESGLASVNADDYHMYAISNMTIGGSGTWIAVNEEWEVHFGWNMWYTTFILRRMGEKEVSHYIVHSLKDNSFVERDIAEIEGRYSHSWEGSGYNVSHQ